MPVEFMEVIVAPAGGIFSIMDDMTRYIEAICGCGGNSHGRILMEPTFEEMITPQIPTGRERMSMGFGFVLTDFDGHRIPWHNGGWYGATSETSWIVTRRRCSGWCWE